MLKKLITSFVVFFIAVGVYVPSLSAAEIESSQSLVLQLSSLPEAKLAFTQSFKFPFLQGESPLTSGNNINLSLTGEVTPICANGIAKVAWTPLALLQFSVGGRIGSGWNIELFGGEIKGIGLNQAGANGLAEYSGSSFDGLHWQANAGGLLQFDFAAIFPGDWNHVVMLTYHEVNYKGYTRAEEYESWYFENDDGENMNGYNYYGNFLVGYQMPASPVLKMIAVLTEMDLFLYNAPGRENWGDDKIRWHIGGILGFEFNEKFSVNLITQFRTRRNFTNYSARTDENMYYKNRTLDTNDPLRLEFYRIAAILTYNF